MLTFLRKIRKSLIDSSSARKYLLYAIGEIALVVIGILIALQINNWNEWRKERIQEKNVLLDLAANLSRNISLANEAILSIEKINNSGKIAIMSIQQKWPYADSLSYHYGQMLRSGSYIFTINKDGYESFKNIGFEILTNKELRNEIIALFEVSFREYENDVQVTNEIWGNDTSWWNDYFYTDLESGIIPIDYEHLHEKNAVLNIIKTLLQQRVKLISDLKMIISRSSIVLQLVNDELENH